MPRYSTRSYGSTWYVDDSHTQPFEIRTFGVLQSHGPSIKSKPMTEAEAVAIAAALNQLEEDARS